MAQAFDLALVKTFYRQWREPLILTYRRGGTATFVGRRDNLRELKNDDDCCQEKDGSKTELNELGGGS